MPSVEGRRRAPRGACRCSTPSCGGARRWTLRRARPQLSPPRPGLAVAIAGEALRRLPDLDALIDSATRQRLPDDSKARMVLRLALAQKIGLGTPDHALVATALAAGRWRAAATGSRRARDPASARPAGDAMPRASGGGRRALVRGLGRRRGRRRRAARSRNGRHSISLLPTIRRRRPMRRLMAASRSRRVTFGSQRVGRRAARLRRRRLVGSGSRGIAAGAPDPAPAPGRARPLRRARRQDYAARRSGSSGHFARRVGKSPCTTPRKSRAHPP